MVALNATDLNKLASKFGAKGIVNLENSGDSDPYAHLTKVNAKDQLGVANVYEGGTGANEWAAPSSVLPTGGSSTPAQSQYPPRDLLDRFIIPNGLLTGETNKVQGVNAFLSNLGGIASTMHRAVSRGVFRRSAITLTAGVTSGAASVELIDKSWAKVDSKYEVYRGSTLIDTFAVSAYDKVKDPSTGLYTVTFAAVTAAAWLTADVIYPKGAFVNGMDSLEDVAGSTTFQTIDPAVTSCWEGLTIDNTGGAGGTAALSLDSIAQGVEDAREASGMTPDAHMIHPKTDRKYSGLFEDKRRYKTGDKLDRDILVNTFDGRPIIVGNEVPIGVWHGVQTKHIMPHIFKKLGPQMAGALETEGALTQNGVFPHPNLNAQEMRLNMLVNLRVLSRNSSFLVDGIAV